MPFRLLLPCSALTALQVTGSPHQHDLTRLKCLSTRKVIRNGIRCNFALTSFSSLPITTKTPGASIKILTFLFHRLIKHDPSLEDLRCTGCMRFCYFGRRTYSFWVEERYWRSWRDCRVPSPIRHRQVNYAPCLPKQADGALATRPLCWMLSLAIFLLRSWTWCIRL